MALSAVFRLTMRQHDLQGTEHTDIQLVLCRLDSLGLLMPGFKRCSSRIYISENMKTPEMGIWSAYGEYIIG